jgi:hypothetical protein
MPSLYARQLEAYGRRWHRPWLAFLIVVASFRAVHWLAHEMREEARGICAPLTGSRYLAAVEIDGLLWTADFQAALACARNHDRRILIAFHGLIDTNARLNEVTVFREWAVQSGLRRYVLVKLYLDFVPAEYYRQPPTQQDQRQDAAANMEFEKQHFHTAQEPLYVVLQPRRNGGVELVGSYDEGRITDAARFARFLRDPRRPPPDDFWSTITDKLRQLGVMP